MKSTTNRKYTLRGFWTPVLIVLTACAVVSLFKAIVGFESIARAAADNPFSANIGIDSNHDGIDDLRVSYDDNYMTVLSQGLPNHKTAMFPNSRNPNSIKVQSYTFKIPLKPQKADVITGLPMGPIGVALNGVPFYNPYNAEGLIALDGYSEEWLDSCCGHPDQNGQYHYHKYPVCTKSPFKDKGDQHSPLIGFAFDGFGIYGPWESKGVMAQDLTGDTALDECNGHTDLVRGYHYHVSPNKFPYVLGGYRGVPEVSNNRMIRVGQGSALHGSPSGQSPYDSSIITSSPSSLSLGLSQQITLELATLGVPNTTPSRVLIGPYEAMNISRKDNVVTGQITTGIDDDVNVYDVAIEFGSSGNPTVLRKKNAFSVGAAVSQSPDFELHLEDESTTIARGENGTQAIHIMRNNGFSGEVTVSAPDVLPAKVKISPASITTLDMAATFKVKVKGTAKAGSYQLAFSGRDDTGRSTSVTVTLVIQ